MQTFQISGVCSAVCGYIYKSRAYSILRDIASTENDVRSHTLTTELTGKLLDTINLLKTK